MKIKKNVPESGPSDFDNDWQEMLGHNKFHNSSKVLKRNLSEIFSFD